MGEAKVSAPVPKFDFSYRGWRPSDGSAEDYKNEVQVGFAMRMSEYLTKRIQEEEERRVFVVCDTNKVLGVFETSGEAMWFSESWKHQTKILTMPLGIAKPFR